MARQETDREDLFAEATALDRRAELSCPGFDVPIVAGFKRDGSFSVYFGGDPVYHFESQGRLKRAFRSGRLYRTQGETLAELSRERTPDRTILHRRDLASQDCEAFLNVMRHQLSALASQIDGGQVTVLRQFPPDDRSLVEHGLVAILRRAADIEKSLANRLAPRFKGKR